MIRVIPELEDILRPTHQISNNPRTKYYALLGECVETLHYSTISSLKVFLCESVYIYGAFHTRSSHATPLPPHIKFSRSATAADIPLNNRRGIFVLGLPFALVQSGYVGLVLLVLSAWICNHTGRTLVVIELLMTCTLYLLVSTSLLSDSLSALAVPRSVCSLVSLVFLLPCLLLTDLRPVSTLSLLCSLAHILISLLVMLYCLSRASSWSWSSLSLSVDPENFIVSVGVIIFSYTSQIFLPPLEGSMEDRGQFNSMLGWTHGAACIMKTMFSLLAVLTWGTETSEVITDNLPSDLRPLVNLCLLAKALLSYPLPFYSAAEILQTCHGGRGVSRPALVVRGALLITSYLLALLVPRFSLLMGLTGSVTGAAMTLILPCLFHLRLQWGCLTVKDRLIDVGILGLGVICSVSGVICSIKRLVETL
uniref:Vesicular inhibitory amino acid transporter n=1 Tax=Acanthochromis polyacanthus TaxID=80966 RepID=A0A3Q1HBD0_9TELE